MIAGNNSNLKRIDFSNNNITAAGAILLSRGITTNNSLEEVNLSSNNFGVEGYSALADMIKLNTSVRTLNLKSTKLTVETAKLAEALMFNSSLKNLYVIWFLSRYL